MCPRSKYVCGVQTTTRGLLKGFIDLRQAVALEMDQNVARMSPQSFSSVTTFTEVQSFWPKMMYVISMYDEHISEIIGTYLNYNDEFQYVSMSWWSMECWPFDHGDPSPGIPRLVGERTDSKGSSSWNSSRNFTFWHRRVSGSNETRVEKLH